MLRSKVEGGGPECCSAVPSLALGRGFTPEGQKARVFLVGGGGSS